MKLRFVVSRSLQMPLWDEETRRNAKAYWQHQRVMFHQESERMLRGKRSNLLTNLVAFDPTKIAAEIAITWIEPGICDCILVVDTRFQWLTDWTKAYLRLEMATFESYLMYGDLKGDVWEQFLRCHDLANLKWALSGGVMGNRMSDRDMTTFLTPAVKRIACHPAA